jgi:alpha-beta hydrolase superfamily lysophospholipase
MLKAIANRELIVLDGLGVRLRGTYHRPADLAFDSHASRARLNRVGVLFVNSLSLPRAASGDSAVRWADSIAQQGYPSFRIDLPGLGDSEGAAGPELLDSINAGGLAGAAAAVVRELVERFGLSGVIVFGHCAGSVSALYAGAASADCKGLILLDPYFHLPQAKRPKVRERMSEWARGSSAGRLASNVYDRVRNLRLALSGSALPANANSQLLGCWKQVAAAGLPILLLKAPGIKAQGNKARVGEFDYIDHVMKLAGRKNRISAEFVEGADHSFANRDGRNAVENYIAHWLAANYPLAGFRFGVTSASNADIGENNTHAGNAQAAAAERYCAVESR